MVYQLEKDDIYFPRPELGDPDGLLAVGGDLTVDRLLLAYSNGIFPWYNADMPILWWCPMKRFIIKPENIHVSGSMKKFMKKHKTQITINRDFKDTMHRCRLKREFTEEGTWISDDMEEAYFRLFRAGYAVSIESYIDDELAGGLYGVTLGKNFFGESMFTDIENGSKIALILLARLLQENEYHMIDCQFRTDHLASMGGEEITYEEYMRILRGEEKGI